MAFKKNIYNVDKISCNVRWNGKTHSRAALSSYSRVGCEKLVCLSSPLHTSTNHCHTATPRNCLVHYNEVWHLSDLDPAIPALGDCMLQHKFNAWIVEEDWCNCKSQQCWMGKKKDCVWWTGWWRAPMSLIKLGGGLKKNMMKNFHLNTQFSRHLFYTSNTLLLCWLVYRIFWCYYQTRSSNKSFFKTFKFIS